MCVQLTTCWYEYMYGCTLPVRPDWYACLSLSFSLSLYGRSVRYIAVTNTQTMLQYHSNQFFFSSFQLPTIFNFFFALRHIHKDAHTHLHGNVFMCEHFMLANICKYLLFMSTCVCARVQVYCMYAFLWSGLVTKVIIKSHGFTSVHQMKRKQLKQQQQ